MRAIILLLFLRSCLIAAEDVVVITVTKTNVMECDGCDITKNYFTRAGLTNLVRITRMTNGVFKSRSHLFYHEGKLVADHHVSPMRGDSLVNTYGGFSLSLHTKSNVLTQVWLADKDENVLDWFVTTNGVLTPVPTVELREWKQKMRVKNEKRSVPSEKGLSPE